MVKSILDYRTDKDNIEFKRQFQEAYPEYFQFMEDLHSKFNHYDSSFMTMGCSYAIYKGLVDNILKSTEIPKHIIEYGPGFTTLLIQRVIEDLEQKPKFFSFENDSTFYQMLVDHGFNKGGVIELVDMEIEDSGDYYLCSYSHDLELHRDADLIFIDGPGKVVVNEVKKENINMNLKLLSELSGRPIRYFIDGRRATREYYNKYFKHSN